MKKGFTLVELLAVIVILGIIALITVISVRPLIIKSKEKLAEANIKKIEEIAEGLHIREGLNSSVTCIDIDELIEKGYLKGSLIKDPKTGDPIKGSVKVNYEVNKYTYTYQQQVCRVNRYGELVYEELVCEEGSFIYGDVNEDGYIDNEDLRDLQIYIEELPLDLSNAVLCAADVFPDKVIGVIDLQILQAYLNYHHISFPYEVEKGTIYFVKYNLGGEIGIKEERVISGFLYNLPNPSKDGYVFLGWTGSNGDTPELYVTLEAVTTKNLEFTAHWKKRP